MKTLTIEIPDHMELSGQDAKMLLATHLFEKGKLTLGQAAEFTGLSKKGFMEILSDYDVSVINHPTSDLENDLKNARDYSI